MKPPKSKVIRGWISQHGPEDFPKTGWIGIFKKRRYSTDIRVVAMPEVEYKRLKWAASEFDRRLTPDSERQEAK